MTRVLIWILATLLALGGGEALAQSRPIPASYVDPAVLDREAAEAVRLLRDIMGAMRRANEACRVQDYRDEKRRFDSLADAIQTRFRTAAVSGGRATHLRSRLDEIGGNLELLRASAPQWDCKSYIEPAWPPPTAAMGPPTAPAPFVSGTGAAPPRQLPAGVTRPTLAPVTAPTLPAQFCSERERVDLIEKIYNPEVAKANANAKAAVTYQGQVVNLANTHMRQGDSITWGVLLAEHREYQPVMEAEIARARDLGDVYGRIMAIPVADCGRVAETAPPPAIAHPDSSTPVRVANPGRKEDCPPKEGRKAIAVGPNGKVGSGARFKSKAASTALGLAGNLLGGGGSPLGGGGKGGGGPPMVNCRIKDSEMTVFRDPDTGTELKVGAKRAKDTLVVFAKIDRSADSGTFQTAFLQKPDGAVLAPTSVGICDLWGEWKLTVSWTRDTYVDNQLVKHEQGGWSEGGRFALPGFASTAERPDGMWRRLGFSNASHGARMVALQYRLPASELAEPMDQVIHVTRPSQDPVITTPFVMTVADGPQGPRVGLAGPLVCPPAFPGTVIADGARPAGGGVIQASNPAPGPTTQVRDGRPKPISDAEPPRSDTLVDLRVEAELARARAAELGGADSPAGARRNVQGRIEALDERLRRMDEAIAQVGGTIDGMKAWEASEEARKVWTKEDTVEDMLDPVENAGEAGIEIGLLALGQPELAPLVVLLDTSEVAIRKAAKELALRELRQNIADQKVKLSDLYKLRHDIQLQRNAETRRLAEVDRANQEFEDKMREVTAERRSQVVDRDARIPIGERANTVRDQGLTEEERAEQLKGQPPPPDAVRPARPARR